MATAHAKRPNVIVFFTDQQRWDTTGLHGNPLNLTPNFDRMARQGTDVHYAFTCQPVCGPARSCWQTGMYATNTGVYRNGLPLNPELPTLAGSFKAAGYSTGYIGKWHLATHDPVPPAERGGYDEWLASNLLEFTSDAYRRALVAVIRDNAPRAVLFGHTSAGMDVVSSLSVELELPLVSSCQRFGSDGRFVSQICGGKIMAEGELPATTTLVSMIPGGYKPEEGQRSTDSHEAPEMTAVAVPKLADLRVNLAHLGRFPARLTCEHTLTSASGPHVFRLEASPALAI